MYSNSKEETVKKVSRILQHEGFTVNIDLNLGGRFYADIVGVRGDQAVIIEIKPFGFKLDQSDLMQVSAYVGALKAKENFQDMIISGCIVASGGTIPPATSLAKELGVYVISGYKKEKIEKEIRACISKQFR